MIEARRKCWAICVLYGPPWHDRDEVREWREDIELRLEDCAEDLRLL